MAPPTSPDESPALPCQTGGRAIVREQTLDGDLVNAALGQLAGRLAIHCLAECDSTNTYLMSLAAEGAASGSVVVAERQTAGRGRRGRGWLSGLGGSLTFSLLWRFERGTPLTGLSLAVGVAIAESLESLGIAGIRLKWPNDILLDGRKLAGILIEVVSGGRPETAVIGVGMNLHLPPQMPQEMRTGAAALAETGAELPVPSELLARLLVGMHEALRRFGKEGFPGVREAWLVRHAFADQPVRLFSDHAESLDGICRGVDDDGALLIDTPSGRRRVISGEVTLRKI